MIYESFFEVEGFSQSYYVHCNWSLDEVIRTKTSQLLSILTAALHVLQLIEQNILLIFSAPTFFKKCLAWVTENKVKLNPGPKTEQNLNGRLKKN